MIGFLGLILALVPAYLIRFHIFGLPTTLLEVLIVVFLFITLLTLDKQDFRKIENLGKLNPNTKQFGVGVNLVIGLFVLAAVISTIISPAPMKALGQLKAYIVEPVLMFYAMVLTVKSQQSKITILRFLFGASVIISLFGLFQYYSFIHLPLRFWGNGDEVQRIVSIFEYPNALSLYLAPLLGLFTTLWLYGYPLTKNRWTAALGLLLIATALLLTFSRGAWTATVIGLLLIFTNRFGVKKIILPALVASILLLLAPSIQNRIFLGISDASSSAHFDLIKTAGNKILANPIFGNGLHGFNTDSALYPHNFILNFWLELGILGLFSFLWILYLCFKQYKKQPNILALAAGIYLIVMLIHGLVDVPYFKNDLSLLFWFVISLFYFKN